jgi:DNA-binding response OmpR family regulator
VILLSGHVSKDDIRKGFEAGCDEYLTKPVDMNRLVRTLKYMIQP